MVWLHQSSFDSTVSCMCSSFFSAAAYIIEPPPHPPPQKVIYKTLMQIGFCFSLIDLHFSEINHLGSIRDSGGVIRWISSAIGPTSVIKLFIVVSVSVSVHPGLCLLFCCCSSSFSLLILVSLPFEREGGATPVITPLIIPNNLQKNQPSLLDLTATILDLYAVAKYMVRQEALALTRELVSPCSAHLGRVFV